MLTNARIAANPPLSDYFDPGSDRKESVSFQTAGLAPVSLASSPFRLNKLEVRRANNGGGERLEGAGRMSSGIWAWTLLTPRFHTVKPRYALLRLGLLCQLDCISPRAARSLSVKTPRRPGEINK